MATAPQLELRDKSGYTTNLYFTTNQEAITLRGVLTPDTVALQVSIDGAAFVTDPSLLKIELNTFVFPNPSIYPSGYILGSGRHTITFRAIDIVGGLSAPSTATIGSIQDAATVNARTIIPSGIRVRRGRNYVDVQAAAPLSLFTNLTFLGFNIYASSTPAGRTGYYRINDALVTTDDDVYDDTTFQTLEDQAFWQESDRQFIRIRVTEEDEFQTELAERLNSVQDASSFFDRVRFVSTLTSYTQTKYCSFRHNRAGGANTINTDQWAGVLDTAPLYYVVTGVYYDSTLSAEYESPYSQEVLGQPLIIDTAILDLPNRTQTSIITTYINRVNQVNAEISLIPGSTTRDVSIDPFASEAERLWFLMDFVHRSQSFVTLLQVDDANNDGVSDAVGDSAYKSALKSALGYTSDGAVQNLVNTQFDKLAKNVNKTRLSGRLATGQVVFYTTTRPTLDLVIPAGAVVTTGGDTTGTTVRFRVGGAYTLPAATAEAYYNFNTKRYEIVADISAENPGADGNVPAGSITSGSVSNFSVVNTEATVGGTDQETNAELAARSIIAFASVDTGTEYGYYSTAAEQVGIVKTKIVKSGDRLMMRDWDDVRKKHIGGKVDVWVQGLRERQVTENFAFSFEIARDVQCQIVDPINLIFRVLDSRVTPTTPIIEMLNVPSEGLGVRNATLGTSYDLTDVSVLDYQTFKLSTAVAQPATTVDDVVYADYRFRTSNKFIFSLQPVRRITSVVGEVSGALVPGTNYDLYKTDDPLLIGESTISEDYISVVQAAGLPVGNQITVNDENHVLIGFVQEPLDSIGINTKTIRVFNLARTVEYNGPESGAPDFEIIEGTDRTPVKIVRTDASTIVNGEEVSVDYTKDENFSVTYVVNDLLQQLQQVIETRRHVTADVVVKQAIVNSIDIETTVQLKAGYAKDKVDPAIRTDVSLELNRRVIGQGIAQSDVINAVDSTTGVDYEIVPLARMAYADGSRILREQILSEATRLSTLDIGGQRVFILRDRLNYPTTDGGGLKTEHRGVFQDEIAMGLVSDLSLVGSMANQAYIIGSSGAVIYGYTDDATLIAAGFTTPAARQAELLARTANHIVVALSGAGLPPDTPSNHAYTVSYNVRGDSGSHDVYGSEVEYVDLGAFTITYRTGS